MLQVKQASVEVNIELTNISVKSDAAYPPTTGMAAGIQRRCLRDKCLIVYIGGTGDTRHEREQTVLGLGQRVAG